ncbi:MAG: hypothetical protein Q9202_004896 [Teloschistes flavicans]
MEKIKNIINPGKSKDDEVMYGSGQSSDPVHTDTGSQRVGSHHASHSTLPSSGPAGNTARDPVGQGGVGSIQQGSHPVPTPHTSGTSGDDAGSAISIKSGLLGNSQESRITGIPETRGAFDTSKPLPQEPITGAQSSGQLNQADARPDSDLNDSRGLGSHGTAKTTGGSVGSNLPDRSAGTSDSATDSGRSFPLGGASSDHTTPGPHTSDLAKKADPRVDSDRDESRGLGNTSGYGSGTGATVGTAHQGDLNRSGAGAWITPGDTSRESLPRGYGEETWSHDHLRHGHEFQGDPCEHEPPAPGAVHFIPGPHSLDTANRLDPHVIGGGPLESAFAVGGPTSHTDPHHAGRDAAMGAGLDAGAYEASRDARATSPSQQGTTAAGPHKSDALNNADTRVDSDLSKQQASTGTIGLTDARNTSTTGPPSGREHHPGRDAAFVGAGGAGAAGFYEAEKHRGQGVPENKSTSGYANPYPPASTDRVTDAGNTSAVATGIGAEPTASSARTHDPSAPGKDHHYGKDAGLVAGGTGAAYETDKQLRGPHGGTTGPPTMDPVSTQQSSSGPYGSSHEPSAMTGVAGHAPSGYEEHDRTHDHHGGRDAAIGAGVGAAAVAGGEELPKKDLEHERELAHKQELKDQKAAHKHELKDEKHHQHELDKERKAHEKAMAKEAKYEKEEAKYLKKDEASEGEKKHHGLFGFLHRDKPDKELKEDELARKEREEASQHPGVGTTAGTAAGLSEMEKHQLAKEQDRNRLHKDPPPGFGETGYAEAPKKGYASQVTGGTGTTALAQGEPVSRGSHVTSLGNTADPNVAGRGDTVDSDKTRDAHGRVIEPHTGLPIDLSKGNGGGGTDSTPVPGYHS